MKRITPATVIACIALAVALSGTSYAAFALPANSVGAKQIKRNAIVGKKIAKNAVTGVKVKNGTLLAADFKAGQLPAGPQGPVGPQGPKGDQGAQGVPGTARAYGHVAADGTLSRAKNVSGITRTGGPGGYCIALAGIDASQTGLVVTPDFKGDSTFFSTTGNTKQSIVEWNSDAFGCPLGTLLVVTGYREVLTTGSPDGDVRVVRNLLHDEPFFFVVP